MIEKLIRYAFLNLLEKIPANKKRFITMTVLYCMLEKKDVTKQMLEKLNHTLKLSTHDEAIIIPGIVTRVVWDDQIRDLDIKNCTTCDACDKVLEKLPSYLKYDTEEKMRADLEQMISIL